MNRVERLFGDDYQDWAEHLAKVALQACTDDHIRHALSQASNDALHNRRYANQVAS